MDITILGPQIFEQAADGNLKSRIGTIFPRHRLLVTVPGVHASQRLAMIEHLNRERLARGLAALGAGEEQREWAHSADLFFEPEHILIRPDPDRMDLAFEADELLQSLVSKRNIRFLFVLHDKVQRAIKERGESWRISPLPRSREGMQRLVLESKVSIHERPIYYYNRARGTRYLTLQEFSQLSSQPPEELARQLQEISEHSRLRNRLGNPEVDFFEVDPLRFGTRDFAGLSFLTMPEAELRAKHTELTVLFRAAVDAEFQEDDLQREGWCNRMFSELVSQRDETLTDEVLRGLSPEFFLQIEWLPGGRFEDGELIFDAVFDEAEAHPDDETLRELCDLKTKGFIFNFIREFGDLDYVNVGRIGQSLSTRPAAGGRRGVYIAELKLRGVPAPILRLIRLQKWGISERLDEGKPMDEAMSETDDYTDYILDRRLGCRQLGMNVPPRVTIRSVSERYHGPRQQFEDRVVRTTYFERDYIPGIATDKVPLWKYRQDGYALRLAKLLGKAAASNLIVGRAFDTGERAVFDDGDEVVIEGADGLPKELIVGDHSGAFAEYEKGLDLFATDYARPVLSRLMLVPQPVAFAEAYFSALREWFLHVQGDYRKRRRAFDRLFKHCRYDPAGSFAFRWESVLKRLDQTDADKLVGTIRARLTAAAQSSPG